MLRIALKTKSIDKDDYIVPSAYAYLFRSKLNCYMANKAVIKSILLVDFDYKVFIVEVLHKNKAFFPCVRESWWAIEDKVRT
jgi:hypothetical protein